MTGYTQLLSNMMDAILAGDTQSAPTLLREKKDFPATAQLAVYTEGYRLRLRDAIESTYPALVFYLGIKEFTALADAFIEAQPSRNFNLDKYTIGFGDYVATHSEDIFASELALLESAIHDVYQREETPAINAQWIQQQTPEALAQAPLALREAAILLPTTFPVNAYFDAFRAEDKPSKPALQKSWLIVLRHNNQVHRLALEEAEYTLLALLSGGLTLGAALENERLTVYTDKENFAFALQRWFAHWVNEGIVRQPS